MATITEDYVSFETAKLLKERGFDELGDYYYTKNGEFTDCLTIGYVNGCDRVICKNHTLFPYKAPTLQMAMKWLREKYNLFIEIQCYGCGADEEAHFEFSFVVSEFMQFDNKICTTVGLKEKKAKSQHNTYEEACEAAIKYCLDNLI